jgi:hypothetical protein
MDHIDHRKKISRSTKASTVLAIPFMDHTDHKKKISRSTKASTVVAIPFMDHTDRKKKISISTKASLPPHSLVMYTSYLHAIFSTLVHCTLVPTRWPCTFQGFLYLARFFSLHVLFRRLNRLLVSSQIPIPHPFRYHSPVKQPSLAFSLSSLCVASGACLCKLTR